MHGGIRGWMDGCMMMYAHMDGWMGVFVNYSAQVGGWMIGPMNECSEVYTGSCMTGRMGGWDFLSTLLLTI